MVLASYLAQNDTTALDKDTARRLYDPALAGVEARSVSLHGRHPPCLPDDSRRRLPRTGHSRVDGAAGKRRRGALTWICFWNDSPKNA